MFLETSALSGENVEEAFLKCTRTILAKIESGKIKAVFWSAALHAAAS
jgi:Ras-related protein Rab-4B